MNIDKFKDNFRLVLSEDFEKLLHIEERREDIFDQTGVSYLPEAIDYIDRKYGGLANYIRLRVRRSDEAAMRRVKAQEEKE